jgi:hypothetical protein
MGTQDYGGGGVASAAPIPPWARQLGNDLVGADLRQGLDQLAASGDRGGRPLCSILLVVRGGNGRDIKSEHLCESRVYLADLTGRAEQPAE